MLNKKACQEDLLGISEELVVAQHDIRALEHHERRLNGRGGILHCLENQIQKLEKKLDALIEATGVTPVEEQVIPFHYIEGERS